LGLQIRVEHGFSGPWRDGNTCLSAPRAFPAKRARGSKAVRKA
jgi:hypothetical protein